MKIEMLHQFTMQCKRNPVSASNQQYPKLSHCTDLSQVSLVGMKSSAGIFIRTASDRGLVNVASQKGANAYLRQMQKDGNPPFSSTFLVCINQHIHKPEESIEERFKIVEVIEAGKGILHGSYITMKSICTKASKDLLREAVTDTELRIIFNHFVSLLKHAISRENKGVIVDEACLHEVMLLMIIVMDALDPSHDIIEDYLKSLASTANRETNAVPPDSGVGYFLCYSLTQCFVHLGGNKIKSVGKAIMMMHKTGMLEQVLRHIHLPWNTTLLNDLQDGFKNFTRYFFITLASSSISLGKMFKAGSPSRDALVDVLQGRIKPCPENKHMMEILEALKKFLDMGLTSGNPDEKYISMQRIECAKCGKQEPTQKLLLCGNCKWVTYCSRECQVADWKDHKVRCREYASHAKTKNLEAIAHRFMHEHRSQTLERMSKIYDGSDLVLDLDFSNESAPLLPPAYRDPPEFEVFPADVFWNREKDKAPDHWFFKDLGGGKTHCPDSFVKYIREDVDCRKTEKTRSDYFDVYVFLRFSDKPHIVTFGLLRDTMKEVKMHSDLVAMMLEVNPDLRDLSTFEKEEWIQFDLAGNELSEKVTDHTRHTI